MRGGKPGYMPTFRWGPPTLALTLTLTLARAALLLAGRPPYAAA